MDGCRVLSWVAYLGDVMERNFQQTQAEIYDSSDSQRAALAISEAGERQSKRVEPWAWAFLVAVVTGVCVAFVG